MSAPSGLPHVSRFSHDHTLRRGSTANDPQRWEYKDLAALTQGFVGSRFKFNTSSAWFYVFPLLHPGSVPSRRPFCRTISQHLLMENITHERENRNTRFREKPYLLGKRKTLGHSGILQLFFLSVFRQNCRGVLLMPRAIVVIKQH